MTLEEFVSLDSDKKREFYLSLEWHDFVMSLLDETEQVDGYPKADGLLRVSELLLGDIVDCRPLEVVPVNGNGLGRATVSFYVTFQWWDDTLRTYGDVAYVSTDNIEDEFLVFATATASTRAEGRALRKALKLKKCTAEEITEKQPVKSKGRSDKSDKNGAPLASEQQIQFLTDRCKSLNIDVIKFINSSDERYNSVDVVTKKKCSAFLDLINQYYRKEKEIPEEVLGYQANWRN